MAAYTYCPKCGFDIEEHGEVTLVGWVQKESDPEGKARLDLILECGFCESRFNAFVPLNDFTEIN